MILTVGNQVWRDIRIGARMLAKTPLFTFFAALILAIAIGANITVFSFFTAIFARPLKIPQPDRFVQLYTADSVGSETSIPDYIEYRDQAEAFASIGAYNPRILSGAVRVDGPGGLPIDSIAATLVSPNFFETVGLSAELGRALTVNDARPGGPALVVLSDECWTRYFGRDPHVLGRRLFLTYATVPFTIVGVMPPAFSDVFRVSPDGWDLSGIGDVPVKGPLLFHSWPMPQSNETAHLVGRLKPGVTRSAAQADLSRIASQLSAIKGRRAVSISVVPGNTLNPTLMAVLAIFVALCVAAVAVVLMIACDDIAILLLARIAGRRREVGIRMALGASRGQLIRQFIAENVLLSVLAGVGAMIVSLGTARIIERLPLPLPMPDAFHLTYDWRVVVFATVLSLATTIFFGIRPALHGVKRDVAISLNPGSSLDDPSHSTVRSNLVIAQVTVCTALLITAAVLIRSERSSGFTEQGSIAQKVVMTHFIFEGTPYGRGNGFDFYGKLLTRLEGIPGIVSASVAEVSPVQDILDLRGGSGQQPARGDRSREEYTIRVANVSPGYFKTLGVPLLDGRDFTSNDRVDSPTVCIINQAAQRLAFPDQNPIGHVLPLANSPPFVVVGVAKDVKYTTDQIVQPLVYRPFPKNPIFYRSVLMVRGSGDIAQTNAVLHANIVDLDPNILAHMRPMTDEMRLLLLPNEIGMYLAGVPGTLAFLLGLIGTFGTMSLLVAQRRTEIGVRIALGARPAQAIRLMLRQGLQWTAIGLALGIIGAVILSLGMSRYFYGISPFDFPAFAFSVMAVAVTAAAACYIPARRASQLDPMRVLREE
jgi:predicted permease